MLGRMLQYIIERSQQFTTALSQHLVLTFIALGISILLGFLLGVATTRVRGLRVVIMSLANLGRTVPSLAILALALPFLGIGTPPSALALVLIGMLPVLINVHVGISQVDGFIVESAQAMGMSDLQVLLRIELPVAAPLIMAGIRTAAVLVVADATLAAFIGGGGLGDLILRGHALNDDYVVLAGALPAALLAFYFEETFRRLEAWATPRGLRSSEQESSARESSVLVLLASILLMPLVFGTLLPWLRSFDAASAPIVVTGIHAECRAVGVPVLLLGALAVLWPRRSDHGGSLGAVVARALPPVLAVIGAGWAIVGTAMIAFRLPGGWELQAGFFLQAGAALAIALVTVGNLALRRRGAKAKAEHLRNKSRPAEAVQV